MKLIAPATKWPAQERFHSGRGWLNGYHTFSFGHHYDPEKLGIGPLIVINDDHIAAKGGFPPHPHDNMEIFSYVLKGALAHKDSMGNERTLQRGDIQVMSAGSGITHSEYNPQEDAETHMLQIWIVPAEKNLTPSYNERHFSDEEKAGKLVLMISGSGEQGSVKMHQDVKVYSSIVSAGDQVELPENTPGRQMYLHVALGSLQIGEELVAEGDGLHWTETGSLGAVTTDTQGEFLLFDLPS